MRGVNKVILVGVLGRDPETKTFPNGGLLCQFSIATTDNWTDKNTGERKEATEWHRITCNNKLAEIAQKYIKKGSKVYIEGKLKTRQWTDQNGQERYTTEIQANEIQMLDSKGDSNYQQSQKNAPQYGKGNNQGSYGNQQQANNQSAGGGQSNLDDDLPFSSINYNLGW